MKLYIRQAVFSWNDRFAVKNAYGEDVYFVEGELFSWGKKLHIYDREGKEIGGIQQRLLTLLPRYGIFVAGAQVAEIVREFSFLYPRYRVDGLGWEIEGSFLAHDYQGRKTGREIFSIHKAWMTWGDCYELDVADPADALVALAVVLAIDCITEVDDK